MRSKASAAARSLYRAGRENSAYRRLVLVQRMLVQVVVRQVAFPNPNDGNAQSVHQVQRIISKF